jgi:signal transduction histidine kinase/ActR/RegA family two-component response regulator
MAFGGLLILAYCGSILITHLIFQDYLSKKNEKQLLLISRNLASTLYPEMSGNKQMVIKQVINSFAYQEDLLLAAILNKEGKVFLIEIENNRKKFEISHHVLQIIKQNLGQKPALLKNIDGIQITLHPILDKGTGNIREYLALFFSQEKITHLVIKARYTILIVCLIVLLIGIFLFQRLSSSFSRSIKDLIAGIKKIGRGNFDYQIQLKKESDLGKLARQFNEMTLKLKNIRRKEFLYNKKLKEHNEKLEGEVQEQTERLRKIQCEILAILDQIPVGIMVVDNEGKIRWFNYELLKILELPEQESIFEKSVFGMKYFNKIGFAGILSRLHQKDSKQVVQHHLDFLGKKITKQIEILSQPLDQSDSPHKGTIFIIKDVTRQVVLEKKMIQDQRLENIGKIAGGIAHDFNNLLAIILPNAQLLKLQLGDNADWVKYLNTIEKAAERAAGLTNKILSFSRGSKTDDYSIVNLNTVVQEFIRMFRRVSDRKIEIKDKLDCDLWNIKAEEGLIDQIMMNLSVNARDAMPKGGTLTFRTENIDYDPSSNHDVNFRLKKGKYVKLEVSDTGIGIPPESLHKIFDPFFSSKKEGKGTGLGLSVIRDIIKSLHGYIDVRSKENHGTTFRVFIPMCNEEINEETVTADNIVSGTGTLLIVDDEQMIQETLKGMLEKLNYRVFFAENGQQAVNVYKSKGKEIDAILMDIQMPIMDGVEAAQKILELNPQAQIIFSSGYTEAKNFEKLRKIGYKLFLKKPYKIGSLADIIQKALSEKFVFN